jgi:type IX secretion system PorP/SprF family membrane protein
MKGIIQHIILCIVLFVLTGNNSFGQDPHFTQVHRIPTFYNPASAGQDVEHIRLTMLYRNQWASVTSPFVTQAVFFDKQVSKVGLGGTLINNSSGEAGIRQLYLNGMLSYRLTLGKHQFAGGLQLGFIQKSFDPSKMTFDDQYTPDQGFTIGNTTNESFSYTKLTRPDFGGGLLWTYGKQHADRFHPYAGISFQHINQPKETFIETTNIIPRKFIAQGGIGIHVNEQLELTPMFLYQQQQFSKEMMMGIIANIPMQDRNRVEGGLLYRNKDAVAIYAGYQWNSFLMGASYDVNISGLTKGPGAFELTLTYIPKAKIKKKPKEEEEDDEEKSGRTLAPPGSNRPSGKSVSIQKQNEVKPAVKNAVKKQTGKPKPLVGHAVKKAVAIQKPKVEGVTQIKAKPLPLNIVTLNPKAVERKKAGTATILPYQEVKEEMPIVKVQPKVKMEKADYIDAKKIYLPESKASPVAVTVSKSVLPEYKEDSIVAAVPVLAPVSNINTDSDNDGIADVKDKCPYQAGSISNNGCPQSDIDADGDGIPNKIDHCPYIKGTVEAMGCPDTDGDGVANEVDPCPYAAGPNGCPDTKTATDEVPNESIGNIEFATNSTEVKGIYKLDIIEPALDSVYDHSNYKVVITGHTDGEGDASYNMVLSQLRADAVKEIFIRKGMNEESIITIAYGETMPVNDNSTEEGRTHNRRVEIHIVKINK